MRHGGGDSYGRAAVPAQGLGSAEVIPRVLTVTAATTAEVSAGPLRQWVGWLNLTAIIASSLVFSLLRWSKLNSLVFDDPAMWLFQMARAARGDLPYQDFSWNYPPLSIWLFSAIFKQFGVTFAAAQATIDVLSLAIALLSYWLVALVLPRALHFPAVLLLIVVGATAQTKFTLFSLLTYSPSLLTGTLGLLLLLIGTILYFRAGTWSTLTIALVTIGGFIAEMSKPEAFIGSVALLFCIAFFGPAPRWNPRSIAIVAAAVVPAVAGYLLEAYWVGFDAFKSGLSGYGLATMACPWWPTGLGVFGAAASLAQAVFLAALATLPVRRQFVATHGKRYSVFLLVAIPCGLLYLGYYAYLNQEELSSGHSLLYKLKQVLPLLLWTNPVLLPVMWASIAYCCWHLYRRQDMELFLILLAPVVMSFRSLFGTTLFPYTEVSAVCYPFFLIIGTILLWRLLSSVSLADSKVAVIVVTAVTLFYCGARLAGGYSLFLSDKGYTKLQTTAGPVLVRDEDGSAAIYRYVVEHTEPQDAVLDLPYGGGVNMAADRLSPVFTTQFRQLRPTMEHQMRDLDMLRRRPPKVIIALDEPAYGTVFGFPLKIACACPRLVWAPDGLAGDSSYVFPLVRWIEQHYHVERKIGSRLILVPNG